MRGKLFLFGLLLTSITGFSQVGIGTTLPNSSSQLEVTATDKGILIPRITLTGTSDTTTITNGNVTSLLIYNTATTSDVTPGFYYWNGTKWHQILNKDNIAALDFTNDAFNNNTTTNVVELNTKSDGISVRDANTQFVIQDTGNVGIGTASPNGSALLDINAANKGMLIPRVRLQSSLDNATMTNGNITSLLVYNEQIGNDVFAGFYYWNGTKWTKIINSDDIVAALNTVDLRLVGNDTHMTKDAGVGGTGTDQGTGSRNIFIGKETGFSNTAGNGNVFIGDRAGKANTTGASNYFIGRDAGLANTTGFANLFMGRSSGQSNISGTSNVFLGYRSGYVNSTGSYNLFLGSDAGYGNTTGYENIFLGKQSGRNNQTGRVNTFIGSNAGSQNTTGEFNSFLGAYAGQFNTEGFRNIFIGLSAGRNNTTASNNIFIGDAAGQNNGTNGQDNVFLGTRAGLNNNGDDNVFIGGNSGENNTDGRYSVSIGREAGFANTTANGNVNVGHQSGRNAITGASNVNIGYRAGFSAVGATGHSNVNIGFATGYSNTTGRDNTFLGNQAGNNNTTGYRNTYVGNQAGRSATTAINNAIFGANSGVSITTGGYNAILGYATGGRITTGQHNTMLGQASGSVLTTGIANTFVGGSTAQTTTDGIRNTFLGFESGRFNVSGSNNINIGYRAGGSATGNNNIVIGNVSTILEGSNQLNIGNIIFGAGVNNTTGTTVSSGSIGLGTAAPKANAILDMSDVTNKGVLMPKVALTSTADDTTVDIRNVGTSISENMLVYNTATVADVTPGYYYWNGFRSGGKWEKLISETDLVNNSVFAVNTVGSLISNSFSTPDRPNYNYRNASFIVGSDNMNNIPKADDDRKMFFNRAKGAFRAGHVRSTQWDDTNVGVSSVAFGYGTIASGFSSYAGGYESIVSGLGSFAHGFYNNASGSNSVALGSNNASSGNNSVAFGYYTTAETYAQTTLGYYNTALAGNTTAAVATDRLFVLGNGTASVKSNALTVLKNGNTTINGSLALNSTDGGFLMPKVALTGTADATTITTGNVEGLLVYNTTNGSGLTPGFYSWNGTAWATVGGEKSILNKINNSYVVDGAGPGGDGSSVGSGVNNTLIGNSAGLNFTTASTSTFYGYQTGMNTTTGNKNTFTGFNAGLNNIDGSDNSFYGLASGLNNISGNYNSFYGTGSGLSIATGDRNIALGYYAGNGMTSGNSNIIIGDRISLPNGNNQLNIGGIIFGAGVNEVVGAGVSTGNIGIGVIVPTERLEVAGNIKASGNIQSGTTTYPDYVFEKYVDGISNIDKTYTFKSLKEVESFIKANKHLPGVTGINDLKKTTNGYEINLTKLSTQTLEKVEELYLYTIAQQKKIDNLKLENEALKARLSKIEAVLGIK